MEDTVSMTVTIKILTWSLAIYARFSYVFCVVYGMLTPSIEDEDG